MLYSILSRLSKVALSILVINSAWAFDSSSAYNVVTMSYPANQFIYNRVVLDSTQKAQGSFTFSADVKNGGGRPTHDLNGNPLAYSTQTDSAFLRVKMYDQGGTLLNTVQSQTYILKNLGSDPSNQFSTKPGDNLQPWSNATVTYTGNLSNVRFLQIELVGTDGAFWAGNYGPMWRAPTVVFGSDATNTVYNPEFGISPNSVKAQGWFNSSNNWAVCGTTSGNIPCVTAEASVTANMWGGGYDINGGSLAGAVGGYDGTLSTTSADTAASTGSPAPPPPPPPSPKAIYNNSSNVFITNHYPTSNNSPPGEGAYNAFDNNPNTKYLNFDKQNAGVTAKLNAGRAVKGFTLTTANDFSGRDPTSYKLYGSNDGATWTLIQEGPLALSDNRSWTSPEITVTNTSAYVYYYIFFPTTKAGEGCGLNCDSMQIAEITFYYDETDTTTSAATGTNVTNPGAPITPSYGPSGASTLQQTRRTSALNENPLGHNAVVGITGDDNIVTIQQIGSAGHYASVDIQGNINTVAVEQTGSNGSRHYLNAAIIGNNNDLILKQSDANKTQFVSVNGNDNTITTNQKGTGSHFLNLDVAGNNHTVGIVQEGAGNHSANVVLSGSQPWNFQLNQNSSTNQNYTLPHGMSDGSAVSGTCAAIGGCNLIVNQQ